MKVVSPAKNCVELDGVTGRRYRFSDGIAEMHPRDAKATVAYGGIFPSMAGTTRREIGFRCEACGFRPYFSTCSRCGGNAVREVSD